MAPQDVGVSAERLERLTRLTHWYVDEGKLPGVSAAITRRGELVYRDVYGHADVERGTELADDTIFRIYSMTKPIASVALLTLYEEAGLLLEDPLSRYLPEFAEPRVYVAHGPAGTVTEPARREITIRDLLTHTSGISAWFQMDPVAALYREHDVVRGGRETLAEHCARLAEMPILFEPGTRWHYGSSTDVLGRVIEVVSGQSLDTFLSERILEPLGMPDTAFSVPPEKADRFCANYARRGGKLVEVDGSTESAYLAEPTMLSAAGGLVGTVHDYLRFSHMLLNDGELDGTRILGRKTVDLMTTNHLPGGGDLAELGGAATFSEATMAGMGFGLGVSVLLDPAANQALGSVGEFAWGGMASTAFWIDPVEELVVVFMTQLMPSTYYPIRRQLKATIHQALLD